MFRFERFNSARAGNYKLGEKLILTPGVINYTKTGYLPNIPKYLSHQIIYPNPTSYLISLEHLVSANQDKELPDLKILFNHRIEDILILEARDICQLPTNRTVTKKKLTLILPNRHHLSITPLEYINYAKSLNPDILFAFSDHSSNPVKECQRNIKFLSDTIQLKKNNDLSCLIFAPLLGDSENERLSYLNSISDMQIDGFFLPSFTKNMKEVFKNYSTLTKPIIALGIHSLIDLVSAIYYGVDLFDNSWAHSLTKNNQVINISFPFDQTIYSINDEELWKKDFNPLSTICNCWTCTSHSRAYIHHLCSKREIIAETLIQCHNQHQIDNFVQQCRTAIINKSFFDLISPFIDE